MTEERVREAMIGALRRIAPEVDPRQLDPGEDLREQADLDSMDFFNLLVAVGEELKVEIPEADAPRLTTLDGAVAYLAERGKVG
jgi:acyl carrier protein